MAATLTPEQQNIVKQFRALVGVPITWSTAIRFLYARKFDLLRAVTLYEQHESIRRREGLIDFDPAKEPLRSELKTGKFTILPKRDASDAAIAVFTAHKHAPTSSTHQVTLQGVVYQLDVALKCPVTQRSGIVFIYDMSNSKYSNFDYELSQKILTMLKGGYPAKLKKVLIVTAPLWFKAPFKILRLFVREKLRERVYTVSLAQLLSHIPRDSLPTQLGGTHELDHDGWLAKCHRSMIAPKRAGSPLVPPQQKEQQDQNGDAPSRDSNNELQPSADDRMTTTINNDNLIVTIDDDEDDDDTSCCWHDDDNNESRSHSNNINNNAAASSASSGFSDDDSLHHGTDQGGGGDGGGGVGSTNDSTTSMTMPELVEYVRARGRVGLVAEYAEIRLRPPDGTFNVAKVKGNVPKNRYTDVLCYDHSRVILTPGEIDGATVDGGAVVTANDGDVGNDDYIHANFVDGYKQRNAFISTQGPLLKTAADFWRMIWQQHVLVVVMTTRAMERGRPKCYQYWETETDGVVAYGQFVVRTIAVDSFTDYTVTRLEIRNKTTDETRDVSHWQFTSWPDYGVPHSPRAMLEFLEMVRGQQAKMVAALGDTWAGHPRGPPIVVHCSAGIGRTGTFCTLDICISRLEDVGRVDVRGTVERIRSQRAYSIQMPDQYVFCHLALIEYAMMRGHLQSADLTGFDHGAGDDSD